MPPEFDVVWNGVVREVEPFVRDSASATPTPLAVRLEKVCAGCGDTFSVRTSEAARRHHCSGRCRRQMMTKICPHCGEDFEVSCQRRNQVHCSQRCQASASGQRRGASKMSEIGRLGGLKSVAVRRARAAQAAERRS